MGHAHLVLGVLVVGVRWYHAPLPEASYLSSLSLGLSHLSLGLCEPLDLQGCLHGSQGRSLLLAWDRHGPLTLVGLLLLLGWCSRA